MTIDVSVSPIQAIDVVIESAPSIDVVVPDIQVEQIAVAIPGPPGPPGADSQQREFSYLTNTTASDPGAGRLKTNNSDESQATEIYINGYDKGGMAFIKLTVLQPDNPVFLYEEGDVNNRVEYKISAPIVNHGGQWFTIPVVVVDFRGFNPNNNSDVYAMAPTPGTPGPPGPPGEWVEVTQAAYDALVIKDPDTLYVIVG